MGSKSDDIHTAARNGDVIAVELIISDNPLAINSRDKHSRTPLHLAAWAGHANVVSSLCKHKADVGAAAMDDMGAIHFAAQKGHLEVVKTLVSLGVSVKAINRKGMTALHYAVQGSHAELTKYLLKKGANVNAKTKAGKNVLDLASNEEIRTLLLDYEKAKQAEAQAGEEKAAGDEVKDEELDAPLEKKEGDDLEETNEENLKRKSGKDDVRESSSKPKKSKVALNHLLASDDIEEDEQ
ncbi:hypothetical protein BVRB_5g107960 [Beta vulgaris subsp. vulgaris]|uniref:uncharacterized protein LOC104893109 n=1 Tax=Beta vulgaris subsp. vulgaris TaxID=3555 RepID=UPI00053F7DA2|nr:uncharacterized protein LOC104893109 [Beta vulgaris subsp. vulgaris]KMT11471.1 hypothetical protein BVRB_5g107960 [Beta vulgaris subsp. vulgaris]